MLKNIVIGLLIGTVVVSPVQAWNATGHRVIASIAFRQLSVGQQAKVAEMLTRHPRFAQDFAEPMPDEVRDGDAAARQEWAFQQAAVWPDMVRSGPPEKRVFHRGEWHYVNQPHFLNDASRAELDGKLMINLAMDVPADATLDTGPLNIVQTIRFARKMIADKQTSPNDRAVLLAWLFHTVGDIHQPLHSTAVFSTKLFPTGDRGGNSVKTMQAGNLHSLWDQFPGQSDGFRESRNQALGEMAKPELATIGVQASTNLDEKAWLDESHVLAKSHVYTDDVLSALRRMEAAGDMVDLIELNPGYLKSGGQVAERRVVEAGYRLGAVLKTLVGD
jgi:S1/P1 Nuclease